MKALLKRWLRRLGSAVSPVPPGARLSYSQEGEDLVLARLFDDRATGFYVDVGAHHPVHLSNTCFFYERGWRGINIDPGSGFASAFAQARPRDINLNIGVAEDAGVRPFFEFNEPALNGFDPELAKKRDGAGGYRLLGQRQVEMQPLRRILERHLPSGQQVAFLTVDAEGFDLSVLRSNDWTAHRPEAVVAEVHEGVALSELAASPVAKFMAQVGYRPICKLVLSAVFVDERLEKRFRE